MPKTKAPAPIPNESTVAADTDLDSSGDQFVGQWNQLVSTTNWEKGRIICQWREALTAAGAAISEYSDEAWAQRVGGVTSQHVGRLRRVFHRFGAIHDEYDGLFWSHFQAGLEWDDAEMWLEGAIQNHWSVSQMRGKRWETVGAPGEPLPAEPIDEIDEIADGEGIEVGAAVKPKQTAVKSVDAPASRSASREEDAVEGVDSGADSAAAGNESMSAKPTRKRLAVEVDELPDDLAEAFEQFKLAIIAHRREAWSETQPETVVECLDALRELALAPLD